MKYELGIIGAGMMAEAIVRGVLKSGLYTPAAIVAADVSADRRAFFEHDLGISTTPDNAAVTAQSAIILLSVKPYQMEAALAQLGQAMPGETLVISVAAGISSTFIEHHLGGAGRRVIRAMPNTPMLVGAGMVGLAAGAHATQSDMAAAKRLFESAAAVVQVPESKIDAVTAISGSGPAYVFFLVEQMIRAGLELGLSEDEARQLAIQTAAGAAKMMAASNESPTELRRKVTTPSGTTHAAITHLQDHHWPETTVAAIRCAADRSREMAK